MLRKGNGYALRSWKMLDRKCFTLRFVMVWVNSAYKVKFLRQREAPVLLLPHLEMFESPI
ncbi:hypothetical protein CHISP_2597 [Chitinispirillum alkaliphilum]|nr:hypothetical protein CHISP_2597 [Chitinispirillum alkaliphilum]